MSVGGSTLRILLLSWSFPMIIFFCWLKLSLVWPATFLHHSLNTFLISWCLRKYNILGLSCIFLVPSWSQSSLQRVLVSFIVRWHLEATVWAIGLLITIKVSLLQGRSFKWTDRKYMHVFYTLTHTHTLSSLFLPLLNHICMYVCSCEKKTKKERKREGEGRKENDSFSQIHPLDVSHRYVHFLSNTTGFTLVFSICNSPL